jgi:hypothetical protein
MRKVQRFDNGTISKSERTPEGYLIAPVRAARIGVLTYYDAYGKPFKEFVPADELFKADSMRTLAMKPLTAKKHPSVMLDSTNYKQYSVGMTGEEVKQDEKFLSTTAIIHDAEAIKMVDQGMQEVSCGYIAELELTSGDFEGEHYDAIQRNRHYNHLCIVDKGRAGREARLRLDSEFNLIKEENMVKIKIGDKEYEVAQEVADALGAVEKVKLDSASELKKVQDALEVAKKDAEKAGATATELQAAKGRIDALEKQVKDLSDPVKINERVQKRMKLIDSAKPMLDEETIKKLDSMEDIDIMKAAILHDDKEAKLDDKDASYIGGRFEGLVGKPASKADNTLGDGLVNARKDAAGCDPKTGMPMNGGKTKLNDRWKQPIKPE